MRHSKQTDKKINFLQFKIAWEITGPGGSVWGAGIKRRKEKSKLSFFEGKQTIHLSIICLFLLYFNCCNLIKFRPILIDFSVLLRKHELFCILPNHSIVCSWWKFPRLYILNYAFSVSWLLEVMQLISPSLSWNAPFYNISMGCKRFNLKLGENLWKNINALYLYTNEWRNTSKQLWP